MSSAIKNLLVVFMLVATSRIPEASAQQVPFISDLFSRYEAFNRLYNEKRHAGINLNIDTFRKRIEEAFKRGSIAGMMDALSEAQALVSGRKWDERQRFISSLTIEIDRLVVEPNQILQLSLTRMFPSNPDKLFESEPTVTFVIMAGESGNRGNDAPAPAVTQPIVVAERLKIGETSSNASRKLLLPDGVYDVVATIEAGNQKIAEIRRPIYAISGFSDSIAQMSKTIAGIKASTDPKVKAVSQLVATPEFQLQRVRQLNRTRGDAEINPSQEIDRIDATLTALNKGQNPFARERGEFERAYQTSDGKLFPYRLYVPRSYDSGAATPLVVMLHGALGDERYYFGGFFDPAVIKSEADRRGWILVGVNGRGRFQIDPEDVSEVINAVSRDYRIDSSRLYLTGHSMGAFLTWLVAANKPDTFAALAPVSGGPPAQGDALNTVLSKLKGVPVMVVHGAQDGIAPAQASRSLASSAEKAGVKLTYLEIPDGNHLSVVTTTFPAVMEFFEKNSRSAAK